MAYAAADLVVARAGAITCSELLVTGKPSILVGTLTLMTQSRLRAVMNWNVQA